MAAPNRASELIVRNGALVVRQEPAGTWYDASRVKIGSRKAQSAVMSAVATLKADIDISSPPTVAAASTTSPGDEHKTAPVAVPTSAEEEKRPKQTPKKTIRQARVGLNVKSIGTRYFTRGPIRVYAKHGGHTFYFENLNEIMMWARIWSADRRVFRTRDLGGCMNRCYFSRIPAAYRSLPKAVASRLVDRVLVAFMALHDGQIPSYYSVTELDSLVRLP